MATYSNVQYNLNLVDTVVISGDKELYELMQDVLADSAELQTLVMQSDSKISISMAGWLTYLVDSGNVICIDDMAACSDQYQADYVLHM